jgi:exopolysaccharide production protein ExoQ
VTAWASAEPRRSAHTMDTLAFAASVLIVLIFSQAWVFPLLGEHGDPSASGLVRVLFLPAYACALFLLALQPMPVLLALVRQPLLLVLMAIVGVSLLWSVEPDQTVRRMVALYATTLGGVVLGARYSWARLAEVIAAAFAILAAASLVTAVAMPSIGVMHSLFPGAWRGLWVEKNALGGIMALGVCALSAAALLNPTRARIWWPFAALALALILLSTSKTSLVALVLGGGVLAFVWLVRRGPAMSVAATWLAVLALGALACLVVFASDLVFSLLGKDATLTGRTRIWAAVIHQIRLRPWTGYGYSAVWSETGNWGPLAWIIKEAGFKPEHAHNAWLEQWLGLGVFGLATFVLFYLQTLLTAIVAVFRTAGAYLFAPYIVVYTLITLTESVAVTYNDFRWVIFVAIAVRLALPREEAV